MLVNVDKNQWLNLNDVYLIVPDDYNTNEILIYIRPHAKFPVILKGDQQIESFTKKLEVFIHEKNARGKFISENDTVASETVLEEPLTTTTS